MTEVKTQFQMTIPINLLDAFKGLCLRRKERTNVVMEQIIREYVERESCKKSEIKLQLPDGLAEKFMTLCASRDSTAEAALETVIRLMVAANEEETDA